MRADRLVAVLLLLQARERVTAAEVAAELEISERTARRDLEALGLAGVPVYPVRGRNGGWRLVGGARTDLSGLTAAEARALFLVAGPSSSATPEVKAALRKLVQALPAPFRAEAEAASAAVVVDPVAWGRPAPEAPPPFLDALQHAVVAGERVVLGYVDRARAESRRVVDPLGLAAKGPVWYLVAGTARGQRTFRVDRVTDVEGTGEPVVRPPGFDLAAAWAEVVAGMGNAGPVLRARGRADAAILDTLRYLFGTRLSIGPAGEDGRVAIEVAGRHVPEVAGLLASLGDRVAIEGPPEVTDHLAAIGAALTRRYGAPPP